MQRHAQAIDGPHQAGLGIQLNFDVLDLEHGVGRQAFALNFSTRGRKLRARGSKASRTASVAAWK